jgi:hypothetical protein
MTRQPVFTRADMRRALDAALDALRPEREAGEPTIALTRQQAKRCWEAIVGEHGEHGGDHACYRCFKDTQFTSFVCVKHQLQDFLAETE